MGNTKPIGVAYSDPDLVSLSVGATVVGGDTGVGSAFAVSAIGAPVRQGVVNVAIVRAVGATVAWDGNPDAAIKASARNYAANAANQGAVRGLDVTARNSGANASWANGGSISARNDSGKTAYQLIGIQTRIENYGTLETEAVGLDINLSVENDTGSPVKHAIRVRNTDGSGMGAVDAVIAISNTSTNGFKNLLDLDGITAGSDATLFSTAAVAATYAAKIRIIMPDGNPAWINVYTA
jgi:hypothetical protein